MKRIKLSTKKAYEVVIENSFSNLGQEVKKVFGGEKILILYLILQFIIMENYKKLQKNKPFCFDTT